MNNGIVYLPDAERRLEEHYLDEAAHVHAKRARELFEPVVMEALRQHDNATLELLEAQLIALKRLLDLNRK